MIDIQLLKENFVKSFVVGSIALAAISTIGFIHEKNRVAAQERHDVQTGIMFVKAIGAMHHNLRRSELIAVSDIFDNFISHGGRPEDFINSGYAPKNSVYRKEGQAPTLVSPYGVPVVFHEISGKPRLCFIGNGPGLPRVDTFNKVGGQYGKHVLFDDGHSLVDVNPELHCVVSTDEK